MLNGVLLWITNIGNYLNIRTLNRRLPVGAAAYGTPRNSSTVVVSPASTQKFPVTLTHETNLINRSDKRDTGMK